MTFSLKATTCFVSSALSETYKTAPLNENIKIKIETEILSIQLQVFTTPSVLIKHVIVEFVAFVEVPNVLRLLYETQEGRMHV
jgi:hypothetical protein